MDIRRRFYNPKKIFGFCLELQNFGFFEFKNWVDTNIEQPQKNTK